MRRGRHLAQGLALAALLMAAPALATDGQRLSAPDATAVDPGRFGDRAPDRAYGAYQRGYYLTARNLALPLAEQGNAAAQTLLGEIYSRGLGVRRDATQAAIWYGRAAQNGVLEARFQLAMIMLEGTQKERQQAYGLMEAAADAGHPRAQFNFAQMVIEREPTNWGMEKAMSYYQLAAEDGIADAQYAVALAYFEGLGGLARDLAQAREWMERAARANFDTAQLDLGTWLVEGVAGERDEAAGFAWLTRAALAGNAAAQNRVGKLYRLGIGVEPDSVMAASWYLAAKRAGLVDPVMEDHLGGLTDEEIAQAGEQAAALRP